MSEAKERAWAIYGLRESETASIQYIGFSRDPSERLRTHLSAARCGKNYRVYDWIRGLLDQGITPVMTILETGFGDGWRSAERRWIACHETPLLNVSRGGGEPANTPASRAAMREKLKGRVFTDEWKAKISASKKGGKRPDNAARNVASGPTRVGKKLNLTDEQRARRSERAKAMPRNYWANISPEERARRSAQSRAQMQRVWSERRANGI